MINDAEKRLVVLDHAELEARTLFHGVQAKLEVGDLRIEREIAFFECGVFELLLFDGLVELVDLGETAIPHPQFKLQRQ